MCEKARFLLWDQHTGYELFGDRDQNLTAICQAAAVISVHLVTKTDSCDLKKLQDDN